MKFYSLAGNINRPGKRSGTGDRDTVRMPALGSGSDTDLVVLIYVFRDCNCSQINFSTVPVGKKDPEKEKSILNIN